ncbi:phosphatase 2C-like domain-containing protein [Ilyonectria destructans]|nr:phosphatase 2C-like domain-containing protein [Ilyonectria destructans]
MAPFARPSVGFATILAARIPNRTSQLCAASSSLNARLGRHNASPCAIRRLQTVSKASLLPPSPITRATLTDSSVEPSSSRSRKRPLCLTNRLTPRCIAVRTRRNFHTYFVTHLPSSSVHPDSRLSRGPGHKLPRDASTPHTPSPGSAPAVAPPYIPSTRDLTVVRIPMRRAKHHLGVATDRGRRPYNEDRDQAGTISLPAFAKRAPRSVQQKPGEATPADSALGDPQVFYFGVFDGHGGTQCAEFIREELPGYIENASKEFGLQSSLRKTKPGREHSQYRSPPKAPSIKDTAEPVQMKGPEEVKKSIPPTNPGAIVVKPVHGEPIHSAVSPPAEVTDHAKAIQLEKDLVKEYKDTIGGYFRRFYPEHFVLSKDGPKEDGDITIESVLTYAFLRADLDFVSAQAQKVDPDDSRVSDIPLNNDEILGVPHATPSGHGIGGNTRFKGGSTASIALISTPTAAPFWHPAAQSTLLCAHVGDSRILLCDTATGLAQPLTSDHHPSNPTETRRLRRYAPAGSMVSGDSFGEERIAGLANSRAFGDMKSKRIGVSAEPEITRVEMGPAEYSFLVLMSDGISGTLSDQEIVDVVKEARTPEEGARSVVAYATEVSSDGDNATCQVVRLGGWERRSEGGLGSLGTKELRDMRRTESLDPRRGKQ